jgi:hypothetical protein
MLRARAIQIGAWEKYAIDCIGPTPSQDFVIVANANNKFVSTELGYTGSYYAMLRARANEWGPWETYWPFPGCP